MSTEFVVVVVVIVTTFFLVTPVDDVTIGDTDPEANNSSGCETPGPGALVEITSKDPSLVSVDVIEVVDGSAVEPGVEVLRMLGIILGGVLRAEWLAIISRLASLRCVFRLFKRGDKDFLAF